MGLKKVGALWLKEGAKGKYMSGEIEVGDQKISVLVFRNDKDGQEKRPDYRVFVPEDDEEGEQRAPVKEESFDDDVPF